MMNKIRLSAGLAKSKPLLVISIIFLIILNIIFPTTIAQKSNVEYISGYSNNVSFSKSVVPIKKTTFINFDEDTYLDDFAYLASVPTTVFRHSDKLFSYPLLFYQDEYPVTEDKELSLNARQGLDYFMDDWMSYCNGILDVMTLINVPRSKIDTSWDSKEYCFIGGEDSYSIAADIALNDWSYSDEAVLAVIDEEFEGSEIKVSGKIGGILKNNNIKTEHFTVKQTNKLNPQYREFHITDDYKYIEAHAWWASINFDLDALFSHIIIPAGDKDIQLYCMDPIRDQWMQVAAASTNNVQFGMNPDAEFVRSYIYESGPWKVGLTDLPTKGVINTYGSVSEILANILKGVTYEIDIDMYPGVELEIPDSPPYGCGDVDITLSWDNPNICLGFSLIGPGGEEILSSINVSDNGYQEIHLDKLGQCLPSENYSVCVFALNNTSNNIEFEIEYSWGQRISEEEGNALTCATEGSVLASLLNSPLLYITKDGIPEDTLDVIYKLGVNKINLVDFGGFLDSEIKNELEDIAVISNYFTELKDIYSYITSLSGSSDVIFSTIDPWTYWYIEDLAPADETEAGLFIGPAAYIAAHHGSPVLLIENHPALSSAVVWHNEFWKQHADERSEILPSVAEMYLTGMRVYDFLEEYGFDQEGMETMITVAGQYDIGISWDRVFPGKAVPGRFWGSPVDTSYTISRNVFYPALIFVNPALDSNGIQLINGSKSVRRFPWYGRFGLKIIKPSQEETFHYPVLQTYICYGHRLNEMFEKYYGAKYQYANNIIPGETNSFNPIDDGVNKKYLGEEGSFYPDIIDSEITPFYASRAGYGNVFSTSFDAVTTDLNRGVLMWIHDGHGLCDYSGSASFWDPKNSTLGPVPGVAAKFEENPWRLYEWYMGSTENPDTMTMEVHGVIPALLGNPDASGLLRTGIDWAPAYKPIIMDKLAWLAKLPIIRRIAPEWIKDTEDYYDGFVNSVWIGGAATVEHSAYDMDEKLENLHSCGYITACCLTANTYYHLSLMRHGSAYQIIDPWTTSWYSSAWIQSIPRDLALGNTIGEAYVNGMSNIGILYITDPPQWWWDRAENVVFFGDPDLRPFVPSTEYSSKNYWEKKETQPLRYDEDLSIKGHMPFGVTSYPNEKEPNSGLFILIIIIFIISIMIILIAGLIITNRRK